MRERTGLLLAIFALAALVLPGEADAQVDVSVSPYVGLLVYDDEVLAFARGEGDPADAFGVDPTGILGARVGLHFLERITLEGEFGFASLSGEVDGIEDVELEELEGDFSVYSVALGIDLSPTRKLSTVVRLGVGGATTDFDLRETDSFTDVVVTVGAGVGYPVAPRVSLRADARGILQFCDEPDEVAFAACVEESTLSHVELSGGLDFDL